MSVWETIWKSILLGTVQGLTEFLPVSSSGHLMLLQRLLGYSLEGGSMTFVNIMLHAGTLLAVIVYFRKDILALFRPPFKTLGMLFVATIPAGLAGLFLEGPVDALFSGQWGVLLVCILFGVTAAMLLVCELVAGKREGKSLGWKHTVPMALMQAVAILPGISRSGSTIATGVIAGGKTEEVSRFSFLMSIPIILGSLVLGLKDVVSGGASAGMDWGSAVGILLGIAAAAVTGLLSLRLMSALVKKTNYKWFSLYLLLLALTGLWLNVAGVL